MSIDPQEALKDIDSVLVECKRKGAKAASDTQRTAMLMACLDRWGPPGSTYRRMSGQVRPFPDQLEFPFPDPSEQLLGILSALRRDYANGMVKSFEEMVHASMFDDLLGQAQGLLDGGYHLAATVVAGATLESHLRELAPKYGLAVTEQRRGKNVALAASALNDGLQASAKAYGLSEYRQVQTWIDLRNEAAHGKPEFQAHRKETLIAMIEGIRAFMVRNPA